jgi:hypothetical protein
MVSRTGILSDEHFYKNCIEYMPMPQGFMNANVQRKIGNTDYLGIKASKYLIPVSRPESMDVYASTLAKFMNGNKAENTRTILNELHRQAKEFVPPIVKINTINQDPNLDNVMNNVMVRPMSYAGTSRGDSITNQTMGIERKITSQESEYKLIYARENKTNRIAMMTKFTKIIKNSGVIVDEDIGRLKGQKTPANKAKEGKNRSAKKADILNLMDVYFNALANIGSNVNLDEIFVESEAQIDKHGKLERGYYREIPPEDLIYDDEDDKYNEERAESPEFTSPV